MQNLKDLFSSEQLEIVAKMPLFLGSRHPTWFPLFNEKPRAIDYLVNHAICAISSNKNGENWLNDLTLRLLDIEDISNSSSSLAEIRAYGGLLEAGFSVTPIPRMDETTPDFKIDAGDGDITVEVFGKHQDKEQDEIVKAINSLDSIVPNGLERHTRKLKNVTLTTTIAEITPGGRPNPSKENDSVQANMISRICAIKQKEKQISQNRPAILIIDFTNFGGPNCAEFFDSGQAVPVESGNHGISSGSIWYALFGWKGAPIFEEGQSSVVKMGHDGRFRVVGDKKSKLSAVLIVLSKSTLLLENPWATCRLTSLSRIKLSRYPWFDISRSIVDWEIGDSESQVELQKRMIEKLYAITNG